MWKPDLLWRKAWFDTRWRFLVGFGLLTLLAAGVVFDYPALARLLPLGREVDASGPMGALIRRAVDVQSEYRGFIWWQWFGQNLPECWTLFAVLLGSGGLVADAGGGGAVFTLSLPASRRRVLGVRAAAGLGELAVLAIVPSLAIPLLSPAVGQHYALADVLVQGACVFIGGAVFFCLALLLSTIFGDVWRPLLIAGGAAVAFASCEPLLPGLARVGFVSTMIAEVHFRTGGLPWPGLIVGVAASAALLAAASASFAQRDF